MAAESADPVLPSVDLLHLATAGLVSQVSETLAAHGLTLDQWRVLRCLTSDGPQSMSELAAATKITGPTLTRVVDRLVERALVYRNVDGTDRRRVVVHAADRGCAVARKLAPLVADAERQGLSALSQREAATLRRLLERLSRA